MIYLLLFFLCAAPITVALLEGKDFKSKDKGRKKKALWILAVIIFTQSAQFATSLIQENENSELIDSVGVSNRRNAVIEENVNQLLINHNNDSIALAVISSSLDSVNELIKESNLIYKNGKLVPKIIESQFYLPAAKFNAPVQQGNGNTQENY